MKHSYFNISVTRYAFTTMVLHRVGSMITTRKIPMNHLLPHLLCSDQYKHQCF